MRYRVAEPNSYLAVTGVGIDNVQITRKSWVVPFQKMIKVSTTPLDFSMALQAMTNDKLQVSLPAAFTIAPCDDQSSLEKYAMLLTGASDDQGSVTIATESNLRKHVPDDVRRKHVLDIVKCIIEREIQSIIPNMTMEELSNNRRLFKAKCVQKELNQFGLRIYNANVKEPQKMEESEYSKSLTCKAYEGAQSQAQDDVANARMIEVQKEREAKEIAKMSRTQTIENMIIDLAHDPGFYFIAEHERKRLAMELERFDAQKRESVSSAGILRRPHATFVSEPEILGYLNDKAVAAFPDSGSAHNIVSHDFARRNQLNIDTSTEGVVQTAAGSRVTTLGTVNLPFQFTGEHETYMQRFHVLSKSLYDVILGSPFLQTTQTFAHQFAHRIKRKLRSTSSNYRVCFTGSSHQMLAGWADGESTFALPDTGSDVCLMSLAYAKARGYRINTDYEHRKQLEFVDGSTAETMGLVEAFQWKFDLSDANVHHPNVYVLEGLQTELLFSYDFLMSSDAFGAHSALFVNHEPSEEPLEGWLVNAIKLVRESKLRQSLAQRIGWKSSRRHNPGPSELQKWHTKKRDESEKYSVNYAAALALSEPEKSRAIASVESKWQDFWATWPGCGNASHCTAQNPCRTAGCNFQPNAVSTSTGGISAVAVTSRARDPFVLAVNAAVACQSLEQCVSVKKDAEDQVSRDTATPGIVAAARTQAKYRTWCEKLIALPIGLLLIWCLGFASGMINSS